MNLFKYQSERMLAMVTLVSLREAGWIHHARTTLVVLLILNGLLLYRH